MEWALSARSMTPSQEIQPRKSNRRVAKRRPLRSFLPSPRRVLGAVGRGLRRAVPSLLVLAGVAALGGGAWLGWRWLTHSPRFALHEVRVEGNARVTREAILRRGGLTPGKNLFRLSLADVERRIAADPWIEKVSASRSLPDGVVIRVSERRAVAVLNVDGGLYLIDAGGHAFKRAAIELGEADGLTVISGLDRKLVADHPLDAALLARRALDIAALWKQNPERPSIGEIALGTGGITLYTLEGAVAVALGRPSDPSDEPLLAGMGRFDAVWGALSPDERAAARTIHLDSKTRPDRVTVAAGSAR